DEAYIQAIKNFLNRHAGWKSFIWKSPLEPSGLWRAESFQISTHGNKKYTLSSTFTQAYHP
ncbi:TPA: phage tail protein, partial [Escherichia coli]|nr:phage tail protein [Escherichia coli]